MLRKILLSSSLLALFVGCGGLQPDTVWEVSRLDGTRPASCYLNGKVPVDSIITTGVQTNVGPWELYAGPDDKHYLVLADKKTVLEGTKASDTFSFQYNTTETMTNPFPMRTLTDSMTNTLS